MCYKKLELLEKIKLLSGMPRLISLTICHLSLQIENL